MAWGHLGGTLGRLGNGLSMDGLELFGGVLEPSWNGSSAVLETSWEGRGVFGRQGVFRDLLEAYATSFWYQTEALRMG